MKSKRRHVLLHTKQWSAMRDFHENLALNNVPNNVPPPRNQSQKSL